MTKRLRQRRVNLAACLTLWMLGASQPAVGQQPQSLRVTVQTRAEQSIVGQLMTLDDKLRIKTDAGLVQEFPLDSLIELTREASAPLIANPPKLVMLVNGDWIVGTTTRVEDDALLLKQQGDGPGSSLTIPLEFVRSIVLSLPKDDFEQARLQRQWALAKPEADRVLYTNTSYTDGELSLLGEDRLVLATSLGAVEIPRADVSAVIMNAELAAEIESPIDYAVLQTSDGSRITMEKVAIDHGKFVDGQLVFGEPIRIPWDRVVRLQFYSQKVVSLADREPVEYVFTPYLTERYSLVHHRNVHGGPLNLRGRVFALGIGMHSRSEASWDIRGQGFTQLTTIIGVDDQANGQGAVEFAIDVDGTRVFESGHVSGRSDPLPVGPIDVTGAERITLSVDFGRVGNIRDIANWCEPRLLK